ncbi:MULTISPECIES: hypothetical protein [unclassified Streptococcus]|uniref:hypothetical protein n=1 Tax=unclassified Streptococcus TaxID=2608887 RepID=UPI00359DA9A5
MTTSPQPSPTGLYSTEKWAYSGLVQFAAQDKPELADLLREQGAIYKTYYYSATDPYAFNSTEEIDHYLAETAAEFLAAMEKGEAERYIQQRTEQQRQAEESGRQIAEQFSHLSK